jgi:hypothetical protein
VHASQSDYFARFAEEFTAIDHQDLARYYRRMAFGLDLYARLTASSPTIARMFGRIRTRSWGAWGEDGAVRVRAAGCAERDPQPVLHLRRGVLGEEGLIAGCVRCGAKMGDFSWFAFSYPGAHWLPSALRTIIIVTVAMVLSGCAAAPDGDRIPGVRPEVCLLPVAERQLAPDVNLPVLQTDAARTAGVTEMSLADLAGRVMVVNFWASWCGPRRIEQPDLNQVHESSRQRSASTRRAG